jgi:hypothetical protein
MSLSPAFSFLLFIEHFFITVETFLILSIRLGSCSSRFGACICYGLLLRDCRVQFVIGNMTSFGGTILLRFIVNGFRISFGESRLHLSATEPFGLGDDPETEKCEDGHSAKDGRSL